MELKEKCEFVINSIKDLNIESSLLMLNININVFFNDCKEIVFYIKENNINTLNEKVIIKKINEIFVKYYNNEKKLYFKENDFKDLIKDIIYIYGYKLNLLFCKDIYNKKNKLCDYELQVKNRVLELINEHIIIVSDIDLRLNSFWNQFFRYINKTMDSFEILYNFFNENNFYMMDKNNLESLELKYFLDSSFLNNKIFKLSNIFCNFYHNLIISLELYLKYILTEIYLFNLKLPKTKEEVLKDVISNSHFYCKLMNSIRNTNFQALNSRYNFNNNYIKNQIENMYNKFNYLFEELDKNSVLEQIRYAETAGFYLEVADIFKKNNQKYKKNNYSSLYSPDILQLIDLFKYLYDCFIEILDFYNKFELNEYSKVVANSYIDINLNKNK